MAVVADEPRVDKLQLKSTMSMTSSSTESAASVDVDLPSMTGTDLHDDKKDVEKLSRRAQRRVRHS